DVDTGLDTDAGLFAISAFGSRIWAAGDFGVIVASADNGSSWDFQATGTDVALFGIKCVDNIQGWAVGQTGTILHTTNGGAQWEPQTSGTVETLNAVTFVNAQEGWIAGD